MTYIAIEGIDGSGKTTITKELYKKYKKQKNKKIKTIKEPYNKEIKQKLEKQLKKGNKTTLTQRQIAEIFAEDRKKIQKTIKKAYKNPEMLLISDRSIYSSLAYQTGPELTIAEIYEINKNNIKPEQVYILDTPPYEAYERTAKTHKYETKEKLRQTYNKYYILSRMEPERIKYIKTTKTTTEEIIKTIQEEIQKYETKKQ